MTEVHPVVKNIEGWELVQNDVTYAGGTTNDKGDFDGSGNPYTIFSVTGTVMVRLVAVCTTIIAGASSTIEVGTAKSTAGLIAQTTGTDIDANEIWHDATPDSSVELFSVAGETLVAQDILSTVGTANVTGGVIKFICLWKPISKDGLVTRGV